MFKQKNTPTKQPPKWPLIKDMKVKKVVQNLYLTRLKHSFNHRQLRAEDSERGDCGRVTWHRNRSDAHCTCWKCSLCFGWLWAALAEILPAIVLLLSAPQLIQLLLASACGPFLGLILNHQDWASGLSCASRYRNLADALIFCTSVFLLGITWHGRTRLGNVCSIRWSICMSVTLYSSVHVNIQRDAIPAWSVSNLK